MSKQCPGKYHGKGIKYINDNEKYCKICQQNIKLNKNRRNERIAGGVISAPLIFAGVKALIKFLSKKEKK